MMEWIRQSDYSNPNDYKKDWESIPVGTMLLHAKQDIIIGNTVVPEILMAVKTSPANAEDMYAEEGDDVLYIPAAYMIIENPFEKKTVC